MRQSSSDDSQRGFAVRRVVAIALVGLLLFSAVGGVLGGSGIAVAQQDGTDGGTTAGTAPSQKAANNSTITKSEFRNWVHRLNNMSKSRAVKAVENNPKKVEILKEVWYRSMPRVLPQGYEVTIRNQPHEVTGKLLQEVDVIRVPRLPMGDGDDNPGVPAPPGNGTPSGDGPGNSTPENPVNATIRALKERKLGWKELDSGRQQKARDILRKLNKSNLSQSEINTQFKRLEGVFAATSVNSPVEKSEREEVIKKYLGVSPGFSTPKLPGINIPSLVDVKLRSLGDAFMESVPQALKTAYEGIWSTPVPKNSGWHQLLGRPTNFPFQPIHASLLQKYIYPLMSKLLGIGLILIAGAILVNPFSSSYRAKDLFINFVTGVTLYVFSWLILTTMHAVTDMAIQFIIPNPSTLTQSVDNLLSLGAAPVALYLFGSTGLFSTLFSLGLEFWLRHVLLAYFLPYMFGALMLIAWVAPHGRLRKFASMGLWQYVNVLLWSIIPAAIFRAIIAVNWNFRVGKGGVVAVFVLITLFLCMIAIPIAQTWFFLQVPGAVQKRVQSNVDTAQEKMESAASRVPNPLPSMSEIKDSATAAMATNEESPGDRATDMMNAASISTTPTRSLSSSSDDASTSSGWSRLRGGTTASKIRSLHLKNRGENMTAEAMKAEYFDQSMDTQIRADGGTETDNHSRHITNL